MKKRYFFTLLFIFLSISSVFAKENQSFINNFNKGDFVVYFEGGIVWPLLGGSLMKKEDNLLNPDVYLKNHNGQLMPSKFTYFGKRYGVVIERIFSDKIGLGIGYSNLSIDRGFGILDYENILGKDKDYLKYENLFAVLNYYYLKREKMNLALIGRFGIIKGTYDLIQYSSTNYKDAYITNWETISINGYNVGLGLGMNWIFSKHVFIGTNFIFTYNQINFKDVKTCIFSKDFEKLNFTSFDWNAYIGVKI
jgi:hypothetical protein